LFLGLTAILGHVAFITLEDLGDDNRLIAWLKIAVVFGGAYFLMSSTDLERRYNSPTWVWATFGALGTIATLIYLTQLGHYITLAIMMLMMPFILTGTFAVLPFLHFALLGLLLMIVNDLRRAGENA
jgi:hypothetical protein